MPPLTSKMFLIRGGLTPAPRRSSVRLSACRSPFVPLKRTVPESVLPPSLGITLMSTPPLSFVIDCWPVSRLISAMAAGLK